MMGRNDFPVEWRGCQRFMSRSENTSFDQFSIDPDIARAWTLPARLYFDPEIYQGERQIFHRTWQVVGHREQLVKPGDYFTVELAGEPLLLVRDQNCEARGFYTVCRHRSGP